MKRTVFALAIVTLFLAGCGAVAQTGFYFTLEKTAVTETTLNLKLTMGNTSTRSFTVQTVSAQICFKGGICRDSVPVPLTGEWIVQPGASVVKEITVPYLALAGNLLDSVKITVTGVYQNGMQDTVSSTLQL
ncbi:MAG: hypothetical protein WCP87_06705 [Atribacterota bacterium]